MKSLFRRIFQLKPKKKYDIINWFGRNFTYDSYLEISTLTTGHYFDKIDSDVFSYKECINYFVEEHLDLYKDEGNSLRNDHDIKIRTFNEHVDRIKALEKKFDVIFVDPFHTVEQTIRDLETALTFLSEKGIIVVHDCLPNEEHLIGPWKIGSWCGQTYEGYIRFIEKHPTFENFVIDTDYGIGIIRPHIQNLETRSLKIDLDRLSEWEYFWQNRKTLLNLQPLNQFFKLYKKERSKP